MESNAMNKLSYGLFVVTAKDGDTLPEDFICPLCKHPASDFKPL